MLRKGVFAASLSIINDDLTLNIELQLNMLKT